MQEILLKIQAVSCDLRRFFCSHAISQLSEFNGVVRSRLRPGHSRVICETRALPDAVIAAQAGIYSASHGKCAAHGLDSRWLGDDQCFELDPNPHYTITVRGAGWQKNVKNEGTSGDMHENKG
jgi:hypothetical protein